MKIKKDDMLLGIYRVLDGPVTSGGTARVWKILHTEWDTVLALKEPRPEIRGEGLDSFKNECSLWFRLGLHPYVVTCHYVRLVEDVPMIFCEWCDGRSVADCIADGSLYTGSAEQQLDRILRIAEQTMIGLCYIHSAKTVHRDVKPENIMLTGAGIAKLTDFGSVTGNSFTPRYASPEQYGSCDTSSVTAASDIYSWALTAAEMLAGGCCWEGCGYGCSAPIDPEQTVSSACERLPGVPGELADLLIRCLSDDPKTRPSDREIVSLLADLLAGYGDSSFRELSPSLLDHAFETAESLNNRALSCLELGDREGAQQCWKEALRISPMLPEAIYNSHLFRWENGDLFDSGLTSLKTVLSGLSAEKLLREIDSKLNDFKILRFADVEAFLKDKYWDNYGDDTDDEFFGECHIDSLAFSQDSSLLRIDVVFREDEHRETVIFDIADGRIYGSDGDETVWAEPTDKADIGGEQVTVKSIMSAFGPEYYIEDSASKGRKRTIGYCCEPFTFSPDSKYFAAAHYPYGMNAQIYLTAPSGKPAYFLSNIGSAEELAARHKRSKELLRQYDSETDPGTKLELLRELSAYTDIAGEEYFSRKLAISTAADRHSFRVSSAMLHIRLGEVKGLYLSPDGDRLLVQEDDAPFMPQLLLIDVRTGNVLSRIESSVFIEHFIDAKFCDNGDLLLWYEADLNELNDSAEEWIDHEPEYYRYRYGRDAVKCEHPGDGIRCRKPKLHRRVIPDGIADFCREKGYDRFDTDRSRSLLAAASSESGDVFVFHLDWEVSLPAPAEHLSFPPEASRLNNEAVQACESGSTASAVELLTRAICLSPMHPEANYNYNVLSWVYGRCFDRTLIDRVNFIKCRRREEFLRALSEMLPEHETLFTLPMEDEAPRVEGYGLDEGGIYLITGFCFSEDSSLIKLTYRDMLYGIDGIELVISAKTGEFLPYDNKAAHRWSEQLPTADLGGKTVTAFKDTSDFFTADAKTGNRKRILDTDLGQFTFSPDGTMIAYKCHDTFTVKRLSPSGRPRFFTAPEEDAPELRKRAVKAAEAFDASSDDSERLLRLKELSGYANIAGEEYFSRRDAMLSRCTAIGYRLSVPVFHRCFGDIRHLSLSPDGSYLFVIASAVPETDPDEHPGKYDLLLFSLKSGRVVKAFRDHLKSSDRALITDGGFTKDGELLLSYIDRDSGRRSNMLFSADDSRRIRVTHGSPDSLTEPTPLPEELKQICKAQDLFPYETDSQLRFLAAARKGNELLVYRLDSGLDLK